MHTRVFSQSASLTTGGRFTAILLMTAGVGLFATLSGALAAWFLRPREHADTAQLLIEIAQLRDELKRARNPSDGVR